MALTNMHYFFINYCVNVDTIRPQAGVFCAGLNAMGCSVAMLTGDHKDVADAVLLT